MSTAAPVVAEMGLSPFQQLVKDYPPDLVQKVRDILEQEKKKDLDILAATLREENTKAIDAAIKDIREKMAPPKPEDIQKLLDQEILEFNIDLPGKNGSEKKTFVIRELPQKVEKKIIKVAKTKLVPIAQELSSLTMNLLEGDAAKKIIDLMNAFEPVLDVVTEVCAIVLNPYGDEKDIDVDWVQEHLSTQKIGTIVMAQFECNRLRDFFLLLSRGMS